MIDGFAGNNNTITEFWLVYPIYEYVDVGLKACLELILIIEGEFNGNRLIVKSCFVGN